MPDVDPEVKLKEGRRFRFYFLIGEIIMSFGLFELASVFLRKAIVSPEVQHNDI